MGKTAAVVRINPAQQDLANLLSYRLSVVSNLMSRVQFARFAPVSDISHAEWRLLVLVNAYGPLPVKALSRHAGLDFGQTSRLVSRLQEAGYLVKKPGVDARSVDLTLTPQGRALHRKLWTLAMQCNDTFLESLSQPERRLLMRALDGLTASARAALDTEDGRGNGTAS